MGDRLKVLSPPANGRCVHYVQVPPLRHAGRAAAGAPAYPRGAQGAYQSGERGYQSASVPNSHVAVRSPPMHVSPTPPLSLSLSLFPPPGSDLCWSWCCMLLRMVMEGVHLAFTDAAIQGAAILAAECYMLLLMAMKGVHLVFTDAAMAAEVWHAVLWCGMGCCGVACGAVVWHEVLWCGMRCCGVA
ncbi:unnamed protein product [Closterium sp. Naga37s-1]|nr:unnamed protein product [Closterium sp. Naga37s-1]CAI5518341.1 unnamed protein product [Closterium sp. Naga37s-1]